MVRKLLLLGFLSLLFIGCQFTETMVLKEDGSGTMHLTMDMREMMAFTSEMDTTTTKMDTLIVMKDMLEEKKDSISKLSKEEQARLKKLEPYKMRMKMNSEEEEMFITIMRDFKDVSEANNIMDGLGKGTNFMPKSPNTNAEVEADPESDVLGVRFSFKKGIFKRDGYVKNEEAYQKQLDSLDGAEAFMGGMRYRLEYTFPRKIKSVNMDDASFSLDGKTLKVDRGFLEYFKNPDVLDLEVVLENK
ncbi:hypothetical protein MG296_01265 [Flavobacteriaceae bacterium TK19130]|nr:hypothetical protein [Thermobacterium salinum]